MSNLVVGHLGDLLRGLVLLQLLEQRDVLEDEHLLSLFVGLGEHVILALGPSFVADAEGELALLALDLEEGEQAPQVHSAESLGLRLVMAAQVLDLRLELPLQRRLEERVEGLVVVDELALGCLRNHHALGVGG